MNFARADWPTWLLAAAGALLVLGLIVAWWRRRPRDPEEVESRRRSYLNRVGRIVEGEILEITDAPAPDPATTKPRGLFRRVAKHNGNKSNDARTLVVYSYSISGVNYQTAQDVTGYEERACLNKLVAGQPASVKYDPANPSNSILISDDWSGLH